MSGDMRKNDIVEDGTLQDGDDIQIFDVDGKNSGNSEAASGAAGSAAHVAASDDFRNAGNEKSYNMSNRGAGNYSASSSSSGRYLQKAGRKQQKKGRKKKIIIAACIAGAACVGSIFAWKHFHPSADNSADYANASYPETVVRTDIQSTYDTTGVVISSDQSVAAAQSSGDTAYPVEEVNVKVGDRVKAGDVLYTLDMSDVEDDLELQKEKMALQQQSNAIDQGTADRQVAVQQDTSSQMYNDETRKLQDKADDTNKEIRNQTDLEKDLKKCQDEETRTKAELDAAQANYDDIHQKYLDAKDDSSDSTEDIAKAQNNLPNVEDNVLNKSTEYQNAKKEASDADAKLSSAQSDYDSKLELYKADPTNTDKAQAFGEAADVLKNAQEEATAKNNAVSSTKDSVLANSSDYQNAKKAITDAQNDSAENTDKISDLADQDSEASTTLSKAQTAYDTAVTNRKAAEDALKTKKDDVETNVRALEDQGSTTLTDNRTQNEAEDAAQDAAAKQHITSAQALVDMEDAIRRAQQKLENGQVKAAIDGTVTAVNVKPGQVYSGSNAVVINNLDDLKISTDVDEAHIADLKVGQKVNITTDSTGTEILAGTVSYTAVAPNDTDDSSSGSTASVNTSGTASTNSSSASTATVATKNKPMYHVEITLDQPSDRLRMGMNAKLEFITAEAKNVLAVPTTCLMDDGMGGYYVLPYHDTSADGSGEATEGGSTADYGTGSSSADGSGSVDGSADGGYLETQIVVTTGIHDDYYTEITSDNLQEGELIEGAPNGGDSSSADASSMMEGVY